MRQSRIGRGGFTMVELMVVIAIIAILMGLAAAAVTRIIAVSQANATSTTIRKVYSRLQSQRAAVMKAAESEDMLKTIGPIVLGQLQTAAGFGSTPVQDWQARTRIMYIKLRLKQEFPQTFAEALNPGPTNAGPPATGFLPKQAYVKAFTGLAGTDVTGVDYQSAACLLLALQQGRQGSAVSSDDYGSTSSRLFTDSGAGNKQVPALIDAWGSPLAYYRWPWGSTELDSLVPTIQPGISAAPVTAASIVRDPEDPVGLLLNTTWYATGSSGARGTFESWCHAVTNNSATGGEAPQYAYYMVPAIVSPGPDKTLGLTPQTYTPYISSTNPPSGPMKPDGSMNSNGQIAESDNIYSFRLMPPGARGD